MLAAMAWAMFGGHGPSTSLAAGLVLTVLAMGIAPFARHGWRAREHLLDVGVMVVVLISPWLAGGGSGGGMAGHGGQLAHSGTGTVATQAPIMAAVATVAVVAWLVARSVLFVAAARSSGADCVPPSPVGTIVTAVVTAGGLVVMLTM